jgi:glutamine phosphoribosylpyrophosphate amidotransferase
MGALAAVVDKRGRNVASLAIAMLDALSHRGSDAYGLASSHEAAIASSTSELRKADVKANGLVGYNLAKILPHDEAQPLQEGDSALAFDGRIFPAPAEGKIQYAQQKLKDNSNNAKQLIRSAEGTHLAPALSTSGKTKPFAP